MGNVFGRRRARFYGISRVGGTDMGAPVEKGLCVRPLAPPPLGYDFGRQILTERESTTVPAARRFPRPFVFRRRRRLTRTFIIRTKKVDRKSYRARERRADHKRNYRKTFRRLLRRPRLIRTVRFARRILFIIYFAVRENVNN